MRQLLYTDLKYFQLEGQIKFSQRMFNYGSHGRRCTDFPLTNNFFLHAFFVRNFLTNLLPNWLAVLHFAIFLWFSFTFLLFNADCFGFLTTNSLVNHFTRFLGNSFTLQFLHITTLFPRNVFTFFLVNFHTFLSRHAFA